MKAKDILEKYVKKSMRDKVIVVRLKKCVQNSIWRHEFIHRFEEIDEGTDVAFHIR